MVAKLVFAPVYVPYKVASWTLSPVWSVFKAVMYTPVRKTYDAWQKEDRDGSGTLKRDWNGLIKWGALATYIQFPGSLPATAMFAAYHMGFEKEVTWFMEAAQSIVSAAFTAGELAWRLATAVPL